MTLNWIFLLKNTVCTLLTIGLSHICTKQQIQTTQLTTLTIRHSRRESFLFHIIMKKLCFPTRHAIRMQTHNVQPCRPTTLHTMQEEYRHRGSKRLAVRKEHARPTIHHVLRSVLIVYIRPLSECDGYTQPKTHALPFAPQSNSHWHTHYTHGAMYAAPKRERVDHTILPEPNHRSVARTKQTIYNRRNGITRLHSLSVVNVTWHWRHRKAITSHVSACFSYNSQSSFHKW